MNKIRLGDYKEFNKTLPDCADINTYDLLLLNSRNSWHNWVKNYFTQLDTTFTGIRDEVKEHLYEYRSR